MLGDCWEGVVERGEGSSLEEAEGFHGCDLDAVLVCCRWLSISWFRLEVTPLPFHKGYIRCMVVGA